MKSESGRTLAEMLGVLSIITLLTISAIKGYNFLVVGVKAQNTAKMIKALAFERQDFVMREKTASRRMIKGPHGDLYVENGVPENHNEYFWIETTLSDAAFCNALKESDLIQADLIEVDGVINGDCGNNSTLAFFFEKNLHKLEREVKNNECDEDISCGAGTCVNGQCACDSGMFVASDTPSNGVLPGECITSGSGCTVNAECENIEGCAGGACYCALTVTVPMDQRAHLSGGTCTPKGNLGDSILFSGSTSPADRHTFYVGPSSMNWINAKNWCEAHGLKLASAADLGFSTEITAVNDGYCDYPVSEWYNEDTGWLEGVFTGDENYACKTKEGQRMTLAEDDPYRDISDRLMDAFGIAGSEEDMIWLRDKTYSSGCAYYIDIALSYMTKGSYVNDTMRFLCVE